VAIALQRLADLDLEAGRREAAAEGYQRAQEIYRQVAELDPGNPTYRRSVATVLTSLGDLALDREGPDLARRYYQEALEIDQTLVADHPDNMTYTADLEVDRDRLRRIQSA
jgi:tetratricopeptide (TPR) repeat protein